MQTSYMRHGIPLRSRTRTALLLHKGNMDKTVFPRTVELPLLFHIILMLMPDKHGTFL